MISGPIDYRIEIPRNHPSGLFWFHPHIHGLSLNQVSSGLAGIITVGEVADYARPDGVSRSFPGRSVRHLILKDLQVLAGGTVAFENGSAPVEDGEVLNQEDPDFCAQDPGPSEVRHGSCPGVNSGDDGNDYTGGKWFFTVNGVQYPTIRTTSPDGEIWRLTNASGSLSYRLQLMDELDPKAARHAAHRDRRGQRVSPAGRADGFDRAVWRAPSSRSFPARPIRRSSSRSPYA